MTAEHFKQSAAAIVTAVVLLVPGASDYINAIGGQAEVVAVAAGVWGVVTLTIHYVHGKVSQP